MKAVILAAGKSTRTYPLTVDRPKSLLPICNKPIIAYTLDALVGLVDEVVMIVGFGREQLEDYCGTQWQGMTLRYVEQTEQLGTGHGVALAQPYVSGRFFVLCGDDLYAPEDIRALAEYGCAALVREVDQPQLFGIFAEQDGRATALVEKPADPVGNLANMGCYVLDDRIFEHTLVRSPRGEYEATDYVSYLIAQGVEVSLLRANEYWLPVGYPWDILRAQEFLLTEETHFIHPEAEVHPEAFIEGPVIIGRGARIAAHAHIHRSVLGVDVEVATCARVSHSAVDSKVSIGVGATVEHSVLGSEARIADNVHILHNHEDHRTVRSLVKGVEVDTKRPCFGCAVGPGVEVATGTILHPGVKIWPTHRIAAGEEVVQDRM